MEAFAREFVTAANELTDHLWNIAFASCAVVLWQARIAKIFEAQTSTEVVIRKRIQNENRPAFLVRRLSDGLSSPLLCISSRTKTVGFVCRTGIGWKTLDAKQFRSRSSI